MKEVKRFTLGVVTLGEVLVDVRASIINIRNCVASIVPSTSSITLFKANAEDERDAGSSVRGSVKILEVKVSTGSDAVEIVLCGSLNEKSSDKVVEGKR